MPVYAFKCGTCACEQDIFLPLEKYNQVQYCHTCGDIMFKDLSKVTIAVDQTIGAYDKQLGAYVESSSHRRQLMKEGGWEAVSSHEDVTKLHKAPKQRDMVSEIKAAAYEKRSVTVSA